MRADAFQHAAGVSSRFTGRPGDRRHFSREYAPARTATSGSPALQVHFAPVDEGTNEQPLMAGRHRVARWRVRLPTDPFQPGLRAEIEVRGVFGRFLVQSYVVEPLLSLTAVHAGLVLIPAAALVLPGGAVLLLGSSRSGKTTLVARATAAGAESLGDDQVFVDPDGNVLPFARRLRLYADLPLTAPAAYAQLPWQARAGLRARGAVAAMTRSAINPPLAVALTPATRERLPLRRILVIERPASATTIRVEQISPTEVVRMAADLLEDQRSWIRAAGGADWREALEAIKRREHELLTAGLSSVPAERIVVPPSWPAPQAVDAVAAAVGID